MGSWRMCSAHWKTIRCLLLGGEDGRRTIELITAIYKSGATGKAVELPLLPSDPFYTVEGMMARVPHFYQKTTAAARLNGEITLGSNYRK